MYPLYAGETLSLKERYRDYIVERNTHDGRVHVRKFLNVFWGEVEFAYAELQADKDWGPAQAQRLLRSAIARRRLTRKAIADPVEGGRCCILGDGEMPNTRHEVELDAAAGPAQARPVVLCHPRQH